MATIAEIEALFNPMHEVIKQKIENVENKIDTLLVSRAKTDEKVRELEMIIENQNKKIETLEKKITQKNLIIFGIEERQNENVYETIKEFFKTKMSSEIGDNDIDEVKRIGKKNTKNMRPTLVEFMKKKKKYEILEKSKLLKGTNFVIEEQYPIRVVEERRKLRPIMIQARNEGHYAILKYDKLNINGVLHTAEELLIEEEDDIEENNSNDKELQQNPLSIINTTEKVMKSKENIAVHIQDKERQEKEKIEKRKATSPLTSTQLESDNELDEEEIKTITGKTTYNGKKTKYMQTNTLKNFVRRDVKMNK